MNIQQASNHTVSGVLRRLNNVPGVTAVRTQHDAHVYPPSAIAHLRVPHFRTGGHAPGHLPL